jgi:hypothetical protein
MLTMRTGLYGASCSTIIFAGLRLLLDGPSGEVVTALTLLAGCVLFIGGAIVDRLDKLRASRPKD